MDTIKLEFDVGTTDAECKLGVRVLIDNNIICDNPHVTETVHVSHELDDADGEHVLAIELYGKLPEHTKITETGEIVSDALLEINNMTLDEVDLDQFFQSLAVYHHDFNGTQTPANHKCYGLMGCNGTVTLKFTTPVYLWLLENM